MRMQSVEGISLFRARIMVDEPAATGEAGAGAENALRGRTSSLQARPPASGSGFSELSGMCRFVCVCCFAECDARTRCLTPQAVMISGRARSMDSGLAPHVMQSLAAGLPGSHTGADVHSAQTKSTLDRSNSGTLSPAKKARPMSWGPWTR